MAFVVESSGFSGPLGLLLELLDKRELQIRDVSLVKIADDYLAYISATDVPTEELADFLLVASRLIYLKSRELLPFLRTSEDDEKVGELEDQLRLYRLFVDAAGRLEERYESAFHAFAATTPRWKKVESTELLFSPGKMISQSALHDSFINLLKRLEPFFALSETSLERIKSVEERLEEMQEAIAGRGTMAFKDIVKNAKRKADVVVSFLALLELVRRQVVRVSQTTHNEITIERV